MPDEPISDPARERFEYLSNEYAQALQAYAAIEKQAGLIVSLGGAEDLRGFIDQFIQMADRTRQAAEEHEEANFVEWFGELIRKARAIRKQLDEAGDRV